jgi:hypothetical protein
VSERGPRGDPPPGQPGPGMCPAEWSSARCHTARRGTAAGHHPIGVGSGSSGGSRRSRPGLGFVRGAWPRATGPMGRGRAPAPHRGPRPAPTAGRAEIARAGTVHLRRPPTAIAPSARQGPPTRSPSERLSSERGTLGMPLPCAPGAPDRRSLSQRQPGVPIPTRGSRGFHARSRAQLLRSEPDVLGPEPTVP